MSGPLSFFFGPKPLPNQAAAAAAAASMAEDDTSDSESDSAEQLIMETDQANDLYAPRRRSSVVVSLSLTDQSATLLPNKVAKVVSAVSKGSTVSLRLGTYMASTVLDSARLGTLTTLGFTRRALESVLYRADKDTANAETWTQSGMDFVNRAATLTQLFTAASFHFASDTLQTTSGFAQDSVHLLDAIFGSTESSRAIAAIISLIRRELGEGTGLYSLVSGLTCFSILQNRGWHRTIEEIEMYMVWDVVVLDTGETLSQQFPGSPVNTNDVDEDAIMSALPKDVKYRVAVTEVTTKTISVDLQGEFEIPQFKLPGGASILHEKVKHSGDSESRYSLTFQKSSRAYKERKGASLNEGNTFLRNPIDDPTNVAVIEAPEEDEPMADESPMELEYERPRLETDFPGVDSETYKSTALPLLTRSLSDSSLSSVGKVDRVLKHSESLNDVDSGSFKISGPSPREPSQPDLRFFKSRSFSSLVPPVPDGEPTIPSAPTHEHAFKTPPNTHQHHKRTSSVCTISSNSPEEESAFRYDSFCANDLPQEQVFPPGHITQNMAKYMRFATASYGQSFMHILGIGKVTSNFPTNSDHHSEHYAFAHHTKLALEDILLSSYSDSAVDNKSGIPLVHFVSIDHEAKAVVLTIRGTLGLEDILTDLTCDYEIMEWQKRTWKAHGGMLKCAQILKRQSSRVLQTIRAALERWGPDYGLVICGHSLGGGVGALFGILLTEIVNGHFVTSTSGVLPPGRRVHCFAYGPPASMSAALRRVTRNLITTVVYGLDMVPCLSLGLLRDFQQVALAFKNDKQGVVHEIKRRFIAQLASRHNPLSVHDADDDYLWSVLKTLRAVMQSEKLVPPGEIYSVSTSTVFETHDGKTKRATRIIGKVVVDVEKRFGEPVFGRGIFHHSPVYYEQALRTLEMGVCNAPVS